MKAWRDDARRRSGGAPDAATLDDLRQRGIDLDPTGHAHDGTEEPGHGHPHRHSEPGDPPLIGTVGAGAGGTALGAALHRGGWPVVAVASRDEARRQRFRELVQTARAFAEAAPVLDDAELIILAVPDDAIAALAGEL